MSEHLWAIRPGRGDDGDGLLGAFGGDVDPIIGQDEAWLRLPHQRRAQLGARAHARRAASIREAACPLFPDP